MKIGAKPEYSFEKNKKVLLKTLADILSAARTAALGGSEGFRKRHLARGKMLPRNSVAGMRIGRELMKVTT